MTLTHEDYTVGWVCALPRELAAARGMLDEIQQDLPAESIDCNAYTLGRIGSHNVVLACLPLGETGVVPATVTVMRMKSTFRCIGIGLVVGVGGGVPSEKHDIRLGDVVVADSGVIQYDMGKTVQGGRFICTQDCQRPPQNLLIAVSKLQSIYRLGEQRIQEYIDKMTSRYPGFLHPGEESDVLYAACYDHPPEEVSCGQCDPIQRVTRDPRQSTHPVVHYGLIASGNQVMRHGATRDKLQREHDVLCFEMEAAGLMREFPSLVIRGICDYSDSHKHKAWQDYAAVTAAAYAKELLSMIPGPLSRPTGKCFMVPFAATPNFVGRNEILAVIDDKLQAKEPVVLAGIGGVGKTQLAVQYCYLYRERKPTAHVFWVNASNSSNFDQSYSDIARALRIPGYDNPQADLKAQVHVRLSKETADPWLMVLDNLDDGQQLASQMAFVPMTRVGSGSIIVTTRDMRVTQYLPDWDCINQDVITIPPLEMRDARSMVEAVLLPEQRRGQTDLDDMLEMLGCFPLALTQALAFIKHNRTTVTHYKRVLEQDIRSSSERLRDLEFRDIRRYGDIPVSVFRTWEVSFGKLHQSELPAAKLLARVSFFDAALGVPETLLWSEGSDLLAFTTALGTLLSFSMVTLGANGSVLMHPLVQQAVHGYITRQGSIEAYLLEGSSRIAVALIYGSRSYWEQLNKPAAHVKEVLSHISNTDSLRKDVALNRATLLLHTARFLNFRSQNSTALEHAEEAYDIRYKTLGGADVDTIESLEAISFILAAQRHYRAAEMKQRAVVEARHLTSPGDVLTVRSKWALADILIVCGQLKEASELCDTLKGAVECEWRRTRTMFHLAQALKGSNRVLAAEQMYRQILAEYEGNPEVAELLGKARIGLNVLLGSRSHESEAYEVYFDRIRWSVTEFGDNHPLTTQIRCELAQLYYQQGNWEAAAQLQDRAYRTYVEVLGETHPTTLAALSDLADMELKLGHPTQAEELHRRAYRQRATAEGPRDPNTLTSMQKLAELLFSMDRYEEACELLKEVVIGRRHALGRNCPETLQAIKALIFVLSQLGNLEEAEALCLEYIQLVREAVPTDDIAAADAMSQLGPILAAQGRLSEAESCYRDLLQLNANRDPSLAVRVFATLGIMLAEQQRFSEAVETYRQALAVGQAVPGMQDLLQSISQSLQIVQRLQENPNRWRFYRSGPKSAAQGLEPDDRSRSNESGNFQSTTMRGLVARLKRRRPN